MRCTITNNKVLEHGLEEQIQMNYEENFCIFWEYIKSVLQSSEIPLSMSKEHLIEWYILVDVVDVWKLSSFEGCFTLGSEEV